MISVTRLRLALLITVFLIVSACTGTTSTPVITEAPTAVPTAVPTATLTLTPIIDPTPTQEIDLPLFTVVNSNPRFAGTSNHDIQSDDSLRYQVVGEGWTPTVRYSNRFCGVHVAPYINQYFISGGNGASRLSVELIQICGEFGLMTRQRLEAGTCYYLKETGYIAMQASPAQDANFNDVRLGARLVLSDNGSAIELREQSFPSQRGSYEIFWIIRPAQDENIMIEIYRNIPWASWDVLAVNEVQSIEVLRADDSQCPAEATFNF